MKIYSCFLAVLLGVGWGVAALAQPAQNADSPDPAEPEESPVATVHLEQMQQYVETPFQVDYRMSWEGDADRYLVFPLDIPTVDWGEMAPGALHTYNEEGRWVVQQEVHVTAHEEGDFSIPTFPVRYVPMTEAETVEPGKLDADTMSDQLMELPFEAQSIEVAYPVSAWVIALPVLAVLGLAILSFLIWWWRHTTPEKQVAPSPYQHAREQFHQAQRLKLDGDWYALYQLLTQIVEQAGSPTEDATLLKRLRETSKAVGFQGKRPNEDEMSGDLRDVERIIARLKEDSRE